MPQSTATVLICCVFAPLVALIGVAVALVPAAWKLPLVGVELLLIVAMGLFLRFSLARVQRDGKN